MRPEFDAQISAGDVVIEPRDVELLRTVDRLGSLNAATEVIGRSYAHAQRRVEELEGGFGPLLDRRRGGEGGGGSELTVRAAEVLEEIERLEAEFGGVVRARHTSIPGKVIGREGELGEVDTGIGRIRCLVSEDARKVKVCIRGDAVTLNSPEEAPVPEGTSARNIFRGKVRNIERGESVSTVEVDLGGVCVGTPLTEISISKLDLSRGSEIVASFKATATHAIEDRGPLYR